MQLSIRIGGGGKITVYNDNWCRMVSAQMHEIGHNLNFDHSGTSGDEYGDTSGMMGYSYRSDDTKMCFNAPKSWFLGWYSNRHKIVTPLQGGWEGKIVGISDYYRSNGYYVLVKIVGDKEDLFVNYNRATRFNTGTKSGRNQILVTKTDEGLTNWPSTRVGSLNSGQSYSKWNFAGSSEKLEISVLSINTSNSPPFATIRITAGDFKIPTPNPTFKPSSNPSTLSPTYNPSMIPSSSPSFTNFPSASPSIPPTQLPSASPSLSMFPSKIPSSFPSQSQHPSVLPSSSPTMIPSASPSLSMLPSLKPSPRPSLSQYPSASPSTLPTLFPSALPSSSPTLIPSASPSSAPTMIPSTLPSSAPTMVPSIFPSSAPSMLPSSSPTLIPSASPSSAPTTIPSSLPSSSPTMIPSTSNVPSLECQDDKLQEFQFLWSNKEYTHTCGTLFQTAITPKQIRTRCKMVDLNGVLVKNYCFQTCNICTSQPSLNPSKFPSSGPSSHPSRSHHPTLSAQSPSMIPTSQCHDKNLQELWFSWSTSPTNCSIFFKSATPQQIRNRCKLVDTNGLVVKNVCAKTCSTCPGTKPSCENTNQKFLFPWNSKKLNCKKLFKSASQDVIAKRCKFVDKKGLLVKDFCKETCDSCDECKDSGVKFKFPWNSKKTTCKKLFKSVGEKKKKNRCKFVDENGLEVRKYCRLTCGLCN
mmetsp:Transcript_4992/g.10034  ORF Transcript_4992/g.10034 Transcript_4992/m.10034 type:complete len:695 (-) Transcript_4992:74-2158(-)